MRSRRTLLAMCLGLAGLASLAFAENAGDIEKKAIATLKRSQTEPDVLVFAAWYFARSAVAYEKANDEDKVRDMTGCLYWCRKKMSVLQMGRFLNSTDPSMSAAGTRLMELDKAILPAGDAQKYFDRAAEYAQKHSDEHFMNGVRYFEIAGRFKGTVVGLNAQQLSSSELQLAAREVKSAKPPPDALKGTTVNLLQLIKPEEHGLLKGWSFDNGVLAVAKGGAFQRLQIPCVPRLEYDLHLVLTRQNDDGDIGVFILCNGHLALLSVSAGNTSKRYAGLQDVDGLQLREGNITQAPGGLYLNSEYDLVIQVRAKFVRAYLNGRKFLDFVYGDHKLTLKNQWQLRDGRSLGLYANGSVARFRIIDLVEAPGSPEQPVFENNVEPVRTDGPTVLLNKGRFSSAEYQEETGALNDNAPRTQPVPAGKSAKPPPATAAQYKAALESLKEIFKEDFAKTAAKDKIALSDKLRVEGAGMLDDPPGKYTLYSQAALLAAQAGDLGRFLELRERLLREFAVDPKDAAEISKTGFAAAAQTAQEPAARKAIPAFKTLDEKPDDPAAASTAGAWFCFLQDNWERGLPMLAKSAPPALKTLAQNDIALCERDAEGAQPGKAQLELGDAWWDFGVKGDKDEKRGGTARAAHWYSQALPSQTGLIKVKLEKRLALAQTALGDAAFNSAIAKSGSFAHGTPLEEAAVAISGTLPVATYQLSDKPLKTGRNVNLTLLPKTSLQDGTLSLEDNSHLMCEGQESAPVIFRNVQFICGANTEIHAQSAIFDTCTFEIAEGNAGPKQSIKLFLRESLLRNCSIRHDLDEKIGFQFIRCAFASMTVPAFFFSDWAKPDTNLMNFLLKDRSVAAGCLFLDCSIDPTFVCTSEYCNFSGCKFGDPRIRMADAHEIKLSAWFLNCTGKSTPATKIAPVGLTESPVPFPVPNLPASTIPEAQAVREKANDIARPYKWISRDAVYTVSSIMPYKLPSPKLMTCEGSDYGDFNCHTLSEDAPDIIIDLHQAHPVRALQIENRIRNDLINRAGSLTVWTGESENGPWKQQWKAARGEPFFTVLFPEPVKCQFVRISLPSKEHLHLNHVRIFE